jgi:DNA repair exonuclease SbcCD ATPase subunit
MILFKKIRWKNFLSTGNIFTEMDLCEKDMTLVIGSNGAGKSTILDALTFGLFGKPFRKISKGQLVNTITKKNCVVEVEFSIGTVNYKIVRGIKPNIFEVYQNDSLMNQSAEMRDYQELLEKQILKVNIKSFTQVVILGSATFQPFMQLSPGQRREVIEDILDLQIFTTMNSLLKDKVTDNNEMIYQVNADKKLVQSKIDLSKEHLKELNSNNEKLISEKNELIEETKNSIKDLNKEYDDYTKEIDKLSEGVKNGESVKKKIDKLKSLRTQIQTKADQFSKDNKFFDDNDDCPTCRQPITETHKKTIIEKNNTSIKELTDGLEKLAADYEKTKNQLDDILKIESKIQDIHLDRVVVNTKIKSLEDYIKQIEKDLSQINENTVTEKDDKIAEYEEELKQVTKNYNDLVDDKQILMAATALLKDGGIKAKIIRQYIPVINKFITKYLSSMDFFVQFELNEEFNETIKSRFRDEFSYASFSEGEKQKIDLALLFTWRAIAKLRNSVSTNLLIMDEVFDSSLDITATDYLMNIIRDLAKDSNIVIISHKEHMNEKFSNVVKFIKHKNFSSIQE